VKWADNRSEFSSELLILRRISRRLLFWIFILAVICYPLSGIYIVGVNETGILKKFGRVVNRRVSSGLHYRIPWPVDKVIKVSTKEIRRFQAGFGADPEEVNRYERDFGALDGNRLGSFVVPYCITGDKNIIHMKIIAQYRIDDPKAYLTRFKDAEGVALRCIQSAILKRLSYADVDSALTAGRVVLQKDILADVQKQLSDLNTGITVFSAEIKNARPPASVAQAFKDVINAREELRAMVHDAQAYRNQIIPEGKAEAARILNEAQAYKTKKIAHARGEAQRFELLASEFNKDKELTTRRLRLDTLAEILPSVRKLIVGTEQGEDIANLRFLTR